MKSGYMKNKKLFLFLFLILSVSLPLVLLTAFRETAGEPWTEKQLLAPAALAQILNDPQAEKPVILSVGPGAVIRGSIDLGPAHEKAGYEKLKQELAKLPANADIVIYCGCCPFEHCPNIRPAFSLLNDMKFSRQRLLNIEHNIKTDWIDKGYPVIK
jgi:hypothetical protein